MISAILILHFTTGGDTFFRQQSRRNLSGPANPYPAFCGGKTKTEKTNALARSCSQEKFHSDRYSTIIEFNNSEFQVEEVRPQTTGTYHRIQGTGDRIQRTENREQRQESREGFYYEPLNPITDLSRDGTGRDNRIVGTTFEIGKPELPGIFQMLGIPNNASYQVKIIEIETDTIKGLIIYPLQPPTTENRDWGLGIGDYTTAFGDWEFVIDRDFYNSDILYPASPVCIDNPGVWRDVNVAILRIYPFAYNPIDSTLIVYKRLIVQISYSMFSSLKVASNYYRMYKSELLNFESMNVEEDKGDSVKYLVIAYDSLLPAIMPLVDWHHKRGIDIEVVPVCSVGITAQEIKSYIANKYYTNGLDYVLLVGDIEHIPLYNWDSYPSQYWYACITGDSTPDMYPDLAIGRLSVKDTAELANQVNKTLTYMKVPLLDDWLTKSILCAHKETSPDNYATFKENIRKYEYDYFNPTFDTVYGRSDGTTAQLISAINEGRNIINYRGHGSTTSWAAWDCNGGYLQDTEVKLLTNIRTPIVLNMCCATGDIGSLSDCLCETWMKAVGGAVAAYGVTRSTNTEPHNIFDEHFYKAFGNVLPGIFDVGGAIFFAYTHTVMYGPAAEVNAKQFILFGDPMIEVGTKMLETIIVKHDTLVFVEDSQFVVDVMTQSSLPVKDALVCIMKDGELYAHQITGTNGRITFKLTLATPGIIYVTVTAHNYLPYEDSAVVENIGCEENAKCKVQNAKLEVYPNPSIRSAVIGYQLAIKGRVSLSLYDITGRLIKPFVDEDKEAGYYTVNWDTKDVSSGVYFIKLETVGYKVTKKLTILK